MRVQLTGLVSLGCVLGVASFVGCGDDTGTGGSGGGTGGSGTSTQTVTVASVSSGMNSDTIGLGCEADGDCGSGEVCVTPADSFIFGGGPANGYCSRRCTTPDECPEGLCVGDDTEAYCLLGCEIGDTPLEFLNSPLDEEKCQGRPETPCSIVTQDGGTACRPACQADSECDGRVCDPRTGMCTATANTGLPTGDACDPDAATDPCAGICVGFGDGIGLCSTLCTFGGEDIEIECGGPANGICLFAPTANELGDAAFCSEGCLSHDDCSHPTFWCSRIGGVTTDVVPNGFCTGAADCPGGQADCTAMNRTCTQTPSGPKCIDPMFPLEAGMGGAGGGGGAGGAGGSGGAGGGGGSGGGAGGAGGN